MCLKLTKDSARLKKNFRRRKKPIIAWKLLKSNGKSQFSDFKWEPGLNISSRTDIKLTADEMKHQQVYLGFHFFLEKPKDCSKYDPNQCRCRYPYQYRCLDPDPMNKLVEFEIDPKNIVAVGKWNNIDCVVAIKAIILKTND